MLILRLQAKTHEKLLSVGGCCQTQRRWSVSLEMNGGNTSEPEFVLVVNINKPADREKLCSVQELNTDELRFKWRPGMPSSEARWMIEDFDWACAATMSTDLVQREVLEQMAGPDERKRMTKLHNIYVIRFMNNGFISYGADPALWQHLPTEVKDTLDRLWNPNGPSLLH